MDGSRLAVVGHAVGDPSRSMVVAALMSGTAHTAGELARFCGLAPSTMSEHLGRLVDAGIVKAEPAGRFRYYRISSPEVAEILEQIDSIDIDMVGAPERPTPGAAMALARSCYDHLAGNLGVTIFDTVERRNYISTSENGWTLADDGKTFFAEMGLDIDGLVMARRPAVRACIDWTERRNHLGGGLGAALLNHMFVRRWVSRRTDRRVLLVSTRGRQALREHFAIDL